MKNFKETTKIKTGRGLFIGDPCYALRHKIYREIWGEELNWEDGVIKEDDNVCAVVHRTAYGDGLYHGDSISEEYPVDSATIGIINMDYSDETVEELEKCGTVIKVNGEVSVSLEYEKGTGRFIIFVDGKYFTTILTGDCEDEEDECYC